MNENIEPLPRGSGERHIFPFLWLRGEDENTLRTMMRVIKAANIDAVCLESRPHPDFCGEGWWRDLDILLDEAKSLDMKLWILDDSHFPTGYCNGALSPLMTGENRDLLRRQVTFRALADLSEGESLCLSRDEWERPGDAPQTRADRYFMKEFPFMEDECCPDVVAVPVAGTPGFPLSLLRGHDSGASAIRWQAPKGRWRVYGIYLTRNRGPHRDYMNMLSGPSCRTLIDAVYEPHYARYKEEFGRTILGFFSDEPEIGNGHIYQLDKRLHEVEDQPWSDELRDGLESLWGSEWTTRLPYLWENDGDPRTTADTRYAFMDTVTRLVERNFSRQVGDWCREHGVRYIGHMIEDHNQHTRCGSSLGHYFRGLAGQDMAGIDNIGGQVLPRGEDLDIRTKWQDHRDGTFYHFCLGRLAASAAAIDPLKGGNAMCEIFGNYGWQEGVNLERYQAEHFMVRGINHFVPHAFSAAPFPDRDCPPHFYAWGQNPQYRHFGQLARYMERVCRLISGGREQVDTAILYHAEADWSGGADMFCQEPARILAEHQVAYHFIPSDVFAEDCVRIDPPSGTFRINGHDYRRIIIPETDWLTRNTARNLVRFSEAGIEVLFMERPASGVFNRSEEDDALIRAVKVLPSCPLKDLGRLLDSDTRREIRLTPSTASVRCLHYVNGYHLIYLLNEGATDYRGTLEVPASLSGMGLYGYDAWDNRYFPLDQTETGAIRLTLEPSKGYLMLAEDPAGMPVLPASDDTPFCSEALTRWSRGVCSPDEYPVFRDKKHVTLPDFPEREYDRFYGFVRYETTLEFPDSGEEIILEISGLEEGLEVFLNGESLGIRIIPRYRYDLSPRIRPGINRLAIEKATTLEQFLPGKNADQSDRLPRNHCGLTGEVRLLRRLRK